MKPACYDYEISIHHLGRLKNCLHILLRLMKDTDGIFRYVKGMDLAIAFSIHFGAMFIFKGAFFCIRRGTPNKLYSHSQKESIQILIDQDSRTEFDSIEYLPKCLQFKKTKQDGSVQVSQLKYSEITIVQL